MIARRLGVRLNERLILASATRTQVHQARVQSLPSNGLRTEDDSNSESSNPAELYLPPLKQLLGVTGNFEKLTSTLEDLTQKEWLQALVRTKRVLTEEAERLRLIDRGIRSFLDCSVGDRQLLNDGQYQCRNSVGDGASYEAMKNSAGEMLALVILSRWYFFKMDPPLINLNDEDKSAIRLYFENQTNQRSRAQGPDEYGQHARLWTANRSAPSMQALTQALAKSDILSARDELERANGHILTRIERISAELDRHPLQVPVMKNRRHPQVRRRIRVVLKLESEWCKLVRQATIGILRCYGGQRRLLIEDVRRHNARKEQISDPRMKEIVQRLCTQATRKASESSSK